MKKRLIGKDPTEKFHPKREKGAEDSAGLSAQVVLVQELLKEIEKSEDGVLLRGNENETKGGRRLPRREGRSTIKLDRFAPNVAGVEGRANPKKRTQVGKGSQKKENLAVFCAYTKKKKHPKEKILIRNFLERVN